MAHGMLARIGRWCFRRRWWVVAVWVVVVAAGALSSGPVFDSLAEDNHPRNLESVAAYDTLGKQGDSSGQIVGLVDRVDPGSPAVRDAVNRVAQDLAARQDVKEVRSPYTPGLPAPVARGFVSSDGQALLVTVTMTKLDQQPRNAAIDAIKDRLNHLDGELHQAGATAAEVRVGGNPALNRDINQAVQEDLFRAEIISLPVTLAVLIIVFAGLVAAGLPVLAAVASFFSAMVLLLGFSKVTDLDSNVVTVVSLLGLGLSIDYGLLLVGRYREELGSGLDPEVALGRAWATAGRTILFSALTVAAALSGLLMFDLRGLSALGAAGVSIAVVALLVSLTLTAALVGAGRRWIKPSKRAGRRLERHGDEAEVGFFARLSRLVQRRPVVVMVATAALLLTAGAPVLTTTIKLPQLQQVPRTIESAKVFDELGSRFGLVQAPAVTVVARAEAATLDTWAERWASDPAVAHIQRAESAGGGLATIQLDVKGDSQSAQAQELVHRMRADRPTGTESWITGDAAVLLDINEVIVRDLPGAVGVTLLAMVVLLFAMTGSLVVPVKAILANVVSLGAAFGVMNAVFQRGWLSGPLDTMTVSGLDPFIGVIVFAFAFALSMDYEVFLLGRIKEYVDRGLDTDAAVRRGLQRTGRIITSAALLMVIVFGCFAAARIGGVEEVGLGLAVAVLIDATIVRCLLVPATMTLMGRWNWWAPAPLKRLHERVGLREHPLPDPEPASSAELAATH
jgi:RND superfamily putative drug exporter